MMFLFIIVVCSFLLIMPVELTKYDIIIIPVPNAPLASKKQHQMSMFTSENKQRLNNKEYNKLDIENYEEPTELPDVDSYNYKDRYYPKDTLEVDDNSAIAFNSGLKSSLDRDYDFDTGDDKIVGGSEVEINLYPYHVAYGTNCGGAVIDKNWVVTAGHCGSKPYIRIGSKYLNQGKRISIKNHYVHPMWSAKSKEHPFDYDFQLLELSEPMKFDESTQPVKIAHIEDMVVGKVVTVTGWGNTEENGPYSNVLRAVRVPIISKENCQHVPYPYFRGELTPRMFCAGYTEGHKDACQGDSGGPAVAFDRLLGMVSFGYGCATPGSYGVYSKIAKVRPWVEEVTGIKFE